jgi:hypothetical protein
VVDFEKLGYETMLECGEETRAKRICALHLQSYADGLQPPLDLAKSEIDHAKYQSGSLHSHLYDRPAPVNDAAMLTHSCRAKILLAMSIFTAVACLAGNLTTFYLFGWGFILTLVAALGMTAIPAAVGHLAYERLVARKGIQTATIILAAILCFVGLFQLADARRMMVDKATKTPVTSSYVDGVHPDSVAEQEPQSSENSELKIHGTLGRAMLLLTIAADLTLGLLAGLLTLLYSNEDYAAWRTLKRLGELIIALEEKISEMLASIEIAQKRCMGGILRAQNVWTRRRPPYHRALSAVVVALLLSNQPSDAQAIDHYEGILIDASGSISRAGATNELFREYLVSTKRLLLTEPPQTRVWVSSISTDSFGPMHDVVKGWTPDARGVFTDDLDRARRQLAQSFEKNSSGMFPIAAGTDIFGGLWRLQTLVESNSISAAKGGSKTIWIFSDMMNETANFSMPALLPTGPEQMLERAKAAHLIVPLNGYRIFVYGATPNGLSPQAWLTVRNFWALYFKAAGAELLVYSADCDLQR